MDSLISKEIYKNLKALDLSEQNKVLDYIRSLLKSKRKERNFMVYHGSLDSKDAEKIRKTIEDGCEKIDHK
ncbi:MAG: hypothetical protein R6U04_12360 [Bacteroidales bacterium]